MFQKRIKPNAVNIVFHEWKQMWKDVFQKGITWQQRMGYLFGPPGWSHDGSRLTSEEMRAQENGQVATELQDKPVVVVK